MSSMPTLPFIIYLLYGPSPATATTSKQQSHPAQNHAVQQPPPYPLSTMGGKAALKTK